VNVDEQESSHEANMRTAANRVKISAKQPQKGRANKVLVSNRSKEPHAREVTPTNRTSPHSEKIQCIITKGDLNSGQGLDPVPDLEQLLDQINIDIDSRERLKETSTTPTEREIMDDATTTAEVDFANAADPIALGNAMRDARLNANLSQSQLSKITSISIRTISRLETGKGSAPLKTLKDIATATSTTLKIAFEPKP
jgi:DNA-binding XRE family transcriptional regulator